MGERGQQPTTAVPRPRVRSGVVDRLLQLAERRVAEEAAKLRYAARVARRHGDLEVAEQLEGVVEGEAPATAGRRGQPGLEKPRSALQPI